MSHSDLIADRVAGLMPDLIRDLIGLMAVPSVSVRGYPEATHAALLRARDEVARLLADAGCAVESIDLPDTAPVVFGHIEAPPGAPTVLLYSHYDVVPAGDESLWRTPPFEPMLADGAITGRGAADTKSNILAIVGALRAWDGRPPVGVKVVVEGMEEVGGGAFTTYPPKDPDRFAADVMIIADLGNVRPGIPTLTVALRGMANIVVEVRTLASAKHSGQYGGAAPDGDGQGRRAEVEPVRRYAGQEREPCPGCRERIGPVAVREIVGRREARPRAAAAAGEHQKVPEDRAARRACGPAPPSP